MTRTEAAQALFKVNIIMLWLDVALEFLYWATS